MIAPFNKYKAGARLKNGIHVGILKIHLIPVIPEHAVQDADVGLAVPGLRRAADVIHSLSSTGGVKTQTKNTNQLRYKAAGA